MRQQEAKAEMFTEAQKNSSGITLVEMMIVVAIVAILAAIAAPDMRTFFINNRLATANNEFVTALNLARNEAMRRGIRVSIRRLSPTSQDWTQGWQIFVDPNGVGNCSANPCPTAELIQDGQPLAASLTLYSSWIIRDFVPFTPDGRIPLDIDNPLSPAALTILCYDGVLRQGTQSRSRALLLNRSGLARPGVDSNGDGRPEDRFGSEINSCTNPT